jgi:hypothetical protein
VFRGHLEHGEPESAAQGSPWPTRQTRQPAQTSRMTHSRRQRSPMSHSRHSNPTPNLTSSRPARYPPRTGPTHFDTRPKSPAQGADASHYAGGQGPSKSPHIWRPRARDTQVNSGRHRTEGSVWTSRPAAAPLPQQHEPSRRPYPVTTGARSAGYARHRIRPGGPETRSRRPASLARQRFRVRTSCASRAFASA